MGHGHDHGAASSRAGARNVGPLRIAFALAIVFLVVEVVTGFLTDSLALLSDAGAHAHRRASASAWRSPPSGSRAAPGSTAPAPSASTGSRSWPRWPTRCCCSGSRSTSSSRPCGAWATGSRRAVGPDARGRDRRPRRQPRVGAAAAVGRGGEPERPGRLLRGAVGRARLGGRHRGRRRDRRHRLDLGRPDGRRRHRRVDPAPRLARSAPRRCASSCRRPRPASTSTACAPTSVGSPGSSTCTTSTCGPSRRTWRWPRRT